jgi:hypothetical protein
MPSLGHDRRQRTSFNARRVSSLASAYGENGQTLVAFIGAPQDAEEEASRVIRHNRPPVVAALQQFAASGGSTD